MALGRRLGDPRIEGYSAGQLGTVLAEMGDLVEARRLQSLSIQMVRAINRWPFHPAMKQILAMLGLDCGPCRLPLPRVESAQVEQLRRDLDALGFFDWSRPAGGNAISNE
jgi:N-acetylneuraminate lyase